MFECKITLFVIKTFQKQFIMADAFIGRFVVESKENYDGFMKAVGK